MFRKSTIAASAAIAAILCGPGAFAQDTTLYFSPQLDAQLTSPTYFEGLYAGVLFGPISARKGNFFTTGWDIRGEVGGVVGWNQPIAPGVIVGGELQGTIAPDLAGSANVRIMGLGRAGFYAGDNTLIYAFGGAGYFATSTVFEFGLGAEWMAFDNMSLRLEAAGIGQIGPVPNGVNIPGVSAVRITAGAIVHLGTLGAPVTDMASAPRATTDFSGPYAGLYAGTALNYPYNFFVNHGNGWHLSRFAMGGMAGWNHALNESLRVGVEGQLGTSWDTSGDISIDALALARVGVVPMEGLMPYAAGGVGVLDGKAAYALGGGVEYALWGDATLRGEWLALGELSSAPTVAGISAHKVTLGTVWHFD